MKTINVNEQILCKTFLYPDGQPHVNVSGVERGDDVRVVCSIRSALDLMYLMEVEDALYGLKANPLCLVIPYLLGARSDRIMQSGDSVDLRVVANTINFLHFGEVHIFDAHNPDLTSLIINRSTIHNNSKLVMAYDRPNAVLICPDAVAEKKIDKYLYWNHNLTEVVHCIKSRDLKNGEVTLRVLESEKCKDRNCVIIDDICDGGATFNAIADQIDPAHLTLIASHGIFSKGIENLTVRFDHIITSDSYFKCTEESHKNKKLSIVQLGLNEY